MNDQCWLIFVWPTDGSPGSTYPDDDNHREFDTGEAAHKVKADLLATGNFRRVEVVHVQRRGKETEDCGTCQHEPTP